MKLSGAISRHGEGEDVRAEAAGYASSRPFLLQTMPNPTSAVMPSMTTTAEAGAPAQSGAGMKPLDFVRTLPSVVNTAPAEIETCDGITAWVSQNPLLAAAALVGVGMFLFRRKG